MKAAIRRARPTTTSAPRLAATFADTLLPQDLSDITGDVAYGQGWNRLLTAVRRDYDYGGLTNAEREDLQERIAAALPEGLRKALITLLDSYDHEELVAQQAGYLVGLAVGRSLVCR